MYLFEPISVFKSFRPGLVQVDVLVHGKDRDFIRRQWVKPEIAEAITSGKISSLSEYPQYVKNEKMSRAREDGLNWQESTHPPTNFRRMTKAEQKKKTDEAVNKVTDLFNTKDYNDGDFNAAMDELPLEDREIAFAQFKEELDRYGIRYYGDEENSSVNINDKIYSALRNLKYEVTDEMRKNIDKVKKYKFANECKNANELDTYFRYNYKIKLFNLKKSTFSNIKDSLCGIDDMLKELPNLNKSISCISVSSSLGENAPATTSFSGEISFSEKMYGVKGKLRSLLKTAKRNHSLSTDSPYGTAIHEMGHIVAKYLTQKKYSTFDEAYKAWDNHEIAREILDEAKARIRKDYPGAYLSDISFYACQSASEGLSECLADYFVYKNNSKPLSKAVWEIVKERL